ncbi:MAG: PepSY domain-containing protein [Planctomycetota bacterium]
MSRHPVWKRANRWSRSWHRWAAVLSALPVVVILATGVILQLKKDVAWIQPPSAKGSERELGPSIGFDAILDAARTVEEAGIDSWADVDRLDVRPDKGMVKVRGVSRWEVQVDTATGEVLQVAYRRSDLIESIHDGSFFAGDVTKLWVFLPAGAALLLLWISGVYLWLLPVVTRAMNKNRRGKRRGAI